MEWRRNPLGTFLAKYGGMCILNCGREGREREGKGGGREEGMNECKNKCVIIIDSGSWDVVSS